MLQKRTEKEEPKLTGVNIAVADIKLKLGKFVRLENWIPGKLNKIKKKRGVSVLTNTPPDVSLHFPCPCGGCAHSLSFACDLECPLGQYAEATFDDATQPSGPAIRIADTSIDTSVTGLAAIYDPNHSKLGLIRFDAQDLTGLGTILDSIDTTLNQGGVLKVEADGTTLYDYHVYVNDLSVIDNPDSGHLIDVAAACVGFIELEDAPWP